MNYDLNSSEHDSSTSVAFNNNIPGLVDNVKITVEKKAADDTTNGPDYRVIFTSENGGKTNMAFWYIKEQSWATVEEQGKNLAKTMKHILHAMYGADYKLPVCPDEKALLNNCMKLISEASKANASYRVFACFGTVNAYKAGKDSAKFIGVRTIVPFIEPMSVPVEETRLSKTDYCNMERLVQNVVPDAVSTSVTANDEEWD